ncbi:MAG: glucan biosynthesis protein D [Proteobacteria bacterium]|nr:glucan biosynthesis protein D [Pseudomonadota bacterium]
MIGRRRFLRGSAAALSAALCWPCASAEAAVRTRGVNLTGPRQVFDYARLKGLARNLASSTYQPPPDQLPPSIQQLDWDHWQSIRYREERSLWVGEGLRFQVRFAHLGFRLNKPVRMFAVENGASQEIAYEPALFDYGHSGLKAQQIPHQLGFGGWRLYFHTDWVRDIAAFQGASYFRAVDIDRQYGMSQRGLAIDTGLPRPEEFPDFVAYYLERPATDSTQLTVYGLLDSPSVAGAYRFIIDAGRSLVMDIDAALYPRKLIERLGIAPGTSMYLVGKKDRRVTNDWRPEIHDSDGLQMWNGSGEWIWRPLVNPPGVHVNSYLDEHPRGFGLMQRERHFEQYQDDGVFYEKRPDAWVEPKGNWGKGAVMLVEIPTEDETSDNVVAFWNPAEKPQRGQELLYGYRLCWCRENPFSADLARVYATRTGIGGVIGRKREYFSWRFVVDFVGGQLATLGDGARVTPVISASRGRVEITSARPLYPVNGWRAMFDLVPPDDGTEPINLRLYLSVDGRGFSETWLYQYTPPPPEQRKALMGL